MTNKTTNETRINEYQQRYNNCKKQQQKLTNTNRHYVQLRITLIILAILTICFFDKTQQTEIFASALILMIIAFAWTVKKHQLHKQSMLIHEQQLKLNQLGPYQIQRQWHLIEPIPESINIPANTLNEDLGVYGHASLAQLLLTESTVLGEQRIIEWLESGARLNEIKARQLAVAELREQIEFQQSLSALAILSKTKHPLLSQFKTWAAEPVNLNQHQITLARVLTFTSISACIAASLGQIPAIGLLPIFGLNTLLLLSTTAKMKQAFKGFEYQESGSRLLAQMAKTITQKNFRSEFLLKQANTLQSNKVSADSALTQLQSILNYSQLRFNAIPYLILQLVLLWDIHTLASLRQWKKRYSSLLPDWLDAIANVEASCAMARLAYQNPSWCQPQIVDSTTVNFELKNAGHPLIEPDKNIRNTIALSPPHQLLVVTGSNMSGKTTYQRTLGLNIKLALAGSVVCADEMTIPHLIMCSSIHVKDSLSEGHSYFMQELLQLKAVIQTARESKNKPVLFLLDEILKGTNIREREIAVREVLLNLIDAGAFGMITTHDINIAKSKALDKIAQRLYFQEEVHNSEYGSLNNAISFDYKVKPGIVKNTNALKLLQLIDIDISKIKEEP